jgi:hypothetical protein
MTQPYALKAGDGTIYSMGVDFIVKVSETRPGSGAAVVEYLTRKGEEPEQHCHPTEDEIFYVLEGKIHFHCDSQTFEVEKGGLVFLHAAFLTATPSQATTPSACWSSPPPSAIAAAAGVASSLTWKTAQANKTHQVLHS